MKTDEARDHPRRERRQTGSRSGSAGAYRALYPPSHI